MSSNTVPPARTKPADVRREELMDAALALFIAQGIAATSMDEIVKAAGVSKGGFYHHFASKDALLLALQDRYVGDFLAVLVAASAARPAVDWRGRLDAMLEAAVRHFFAELPVHDVVFHEYAPVERREMNQNPIVDHMAAFLKAGAEAGAWRAERPKLLAVMLFGAMHGACDEAILSPGLIDRDGLIALLQDFFWRALRPD